MITVVSYGERHGPPPACDLHVDCTVFGMPPPAVRAGTGLDSVVAEYVLSEPLAYDYITLLAKWASERDTPYTLIACGCVDGRHRSVAVAEEIARRLKRAGVDTQVIHRDLGIGMAGG